MHMAKLNFNIRRSLHKQYRL